MKIKYKYFQLFLLLAMLIGSCKKDELQSVDPMINGINIQALKTAEGFNSGAWNSALIGLRDQRIKLVGVKKLIAEGKYSGDKYALKDPALATKNANETLVIIDFKIDSLWSKYIKNDFDALNPNSAGISNFGLTAYNAVKDKFTGIYAWLNAESNDPGTAAYVPNDFVQFQSEIAVLTGLNALNETEVLAYVNDLKAQFASMKQQYADLASLVASSPYFSKAQKAIYTKLNQPMIEMETTINTKLDLSTKGQLDAINRDLSALVYFVANNYTSPAQKPIVFGEISSITELRWFSEVATDNERTGNWILTTDIDAAETKRWNPSSIAPGFKNIDKFNGTFDGKNHIIWGLYMTNSQGGNNRPGFFNNITGTIKNLGLVKLFIRSVSGANGQGGSLFGFMTNGTATNCFVTGVNQRNNQSGGFAGRTGGTVTIEDCFSAVNTPNGTGDVSNSSSFLGLPTGSLILKNCYTIGANPTRVFFGFPSGLNLMVASGLFFDPQTVGATTLDFNNNNYAGNTVTRLIDAGVTALPTAQWNNLSNFPGLVSTKWEIKTVTEIDANPRPYLKGFNYDALRDFIQP